MALRGIDGLHDVDDAIHRHFRVFRDEASDRLNDGVATQQFDVLHHHRRPLLRLQLTFQPLGEGLRKRQERQYNQNKRTEKRQTEEGTDGDTDRN